MATESHRGASHQRIEGHSHTGASDPGRPVARSQRVADVGSAADELGNLKLEG